MSLPYQIIRANLRKTIDTIQNDPLVGICQLGNYSINVRFTTGIHENWFRSPEYCSLAYQLKMPEDQFSGKPIRIRYQYQFNPWDEDIAIKQKLFLLRYKDWKRGSFLEQRLSIQRLLFKLLLDGWTDIKFPESELRADLERLLEADLEAYKHNGIGLAWGFGNNRNGLKLIEHFSNWGYYGKRQLNRAWDEPNVLYRAINLNLRYKVDVTRFSICARLHNKIRIGINFICPNSYRMIFKHFHIHDCLLADPYPDPGNKAIAAILENCQYYSPVYSSDLFKFIGGSVKQLDEEKHYDCVFLDYGFEDHGLGTIQGDMQKWRKNCDILLVYVPAQYRTSLPKPDRFLPFKLLSFKETNFIFYYL